MDLRKGSLTDNVQDVLSGWILRGFLILCVCGVLKMLFVFYRFGVTFW